MRTRSGGRASGDRTDSTLVDTMLLFDWNGTIVIDSDHAHAALTTVLARRGLRTLGEAEFALRFRLPLGELLERLGVEPADVPAAEEEWTAALAESRTQLREGAADCLRALAGAGAWLGVVSGASPSAVRFDQRALQVPPVWNSVDTGVGDTLELLLRHRAVRERAFFVGDDPDDLRCASVAGYLPVGVTDAPADAPALRAAGALHVIGDLDELPAIVAAPLSARRVPAPAGQLLNEP
ncbi:HAD family hydrolase [Herbiconiux sp. VKM Ac-1786]|uniref:HAD family hydrolase n=1 Tax=Herbiconiux sp. VKM Ac-1786 TaxID=2783824 RepID=UPI00188C2A13|nr:HAD family hydrolase [Herbiconiux sp. VKM Ac-1786]